MTARPPRRDARAPSAPAAPRALRRLALVVSTAPSCGDLDRAEGLARAALARGLDVGLFLMDAAAPWAADPRAAALVAEGCDVTVCGTDAARLGLAALAPGVVEGSQDDHAALVARADRVLALT